MEQQNEELYSMLVPLHQHRLIVPRACVAEVVRYVPSERVAGEPALGGVVFAVEDPRRLGEVGLAS